MKNLDLSVVEILSNIRYRILANAHLPVPAKFDDLSKDDYSEIFSSYHETCNLLSSLIDLINIQEKYADND